MAICAKPHIYMHTYIWKINYKKKGADTSENGSLKKVGWRCLHEGEIFWTRVFQCFVFQFSKYLMYENIIIKQIGKESKS